MSVFNYVGRDGQGTVVRGHLEAETKEQALRLLHDRMVFPTRVSEGRTGTGGPSWNIELSSRVPIRDLAVFVRQFGAAVRAGVPALRALRLVADGNGHKRKMISEVVGRAAERVQAGSTLADAFRPEERRLPSTFLPFLRAGEAGGTLDEVLWRLADYYESQDAFVSKLRSALAYPAIVVLMSFGVVLFLLTTVVPNFALLYSSFHAQLPFTTSLMLSSGQWLTLHWPIAMMVLLALVGGVVAVSRTPTAATLLEPVRRRMPIFGPLALQGGVARFSRTLATLLRAGVPILEALDVAGEMLPFASSRDRVRHAAERVGRGEPLASSLRTAPMDFPPMLLQMVEVGEESGEIDEMLDRAATFFERDVEATLNRLSTLLEPILVVFLGTIVATIIGSILVPMYSLFGHVQ